MSHDHDLAIALSGSEYVVPRRQLDLAKDGINERLEVRLPDGATVYVSGGYISLTPTEGIGWRLFRSETGLWYALGRGHRSRSRAATEA